MAEPTYPTWEASRRPRRPRRESKRRRTEKELAEKPKLNIDRKALILQALAVRKQQTKLLEDLPPDQKEKLQAMAMQAFGINPAKGKR